MINFLSRINNKINYFEVFRNTYFILQQRIFFNSKKNVKNEF